MSESAPQTNSRGPAIIVGTLAAFASFAVIAAVIQAVAGGRPADPLTAKRLEFKAEIAGAQSALLAKYGLADKADAVIAKSIDQIQARKIETSKVVVPGSPTAIKQSAAAPAPAPAPGAPAPTAATPANPAAAPPPVPASAPVPSPPTEVRPAVPASSTPAPAPVPAAPPPAPPVPGTNPR